MRGHGAGAYVDCYDVYEDVESSQPRLTALLHAALNGQVEAAGLLLQTGAAVDLPTKVHREPTWDHTEESFDGFTALHAACHQGAGPRTPPRVRLALVELLIEAGADPNLRGVFHDCSREQRTADLSDVTPLHLAISSSCFQVA